MRRHRRLSARCCRPSPRLRPCRATQRPRPRRPRCARHPVVATVRGPARQRAAGRQHPWKQPGKLGWCWQKADRVTTRLLRPTRRPPRLRRPRPLHLPARRRPVLRRPRLCGAASARLLRGLGSRPLPPAPAQPVVAPLPSSLLQLRHPPPTRTPTPAPPAAAPRTWPWRLQRPRDSPARTRCHPRRLHCVCQRRRPRRVRPRRRCRRRRRRPVPPPHSRR